MWASLSPRKLSTRPAGRVLATVTSHTWLAQPRTLLASVRSLSVSGARLAAEVDHVAVAVVPLVEQREVLDDLLDRRLVAGRQHGCCLVEFSVRSNSSKPRTAAAIKTSKIPARQVSFVKAPAIRLFCSRQPVAPVSIADGRCRVLNKREKTRIVPLSIDKRFDISSRPALAHSLQKLLPPRRMVAGFAPPSRKSNVRTRAVRR